METEGNQTSYYGSACSICCGEILSDYVMLVRRDRLKALLINAFMRNTKMTSFPNVQLRN